MGMLQEEITRRSVIEVPAGLSSVSRSAVHLPRSFRRQCRRLRRCPRRAALMTSVPRFMDTHRSDNSSRSFTGKAELGQGIRTALLQVPPRSSKSTRGIRLITADTGRTPNEGLRQQPVDAKTAVPPSGTLQRRCGSCYCRSCQRFGMAATELRAETRGAGKRGRRRPRRTRFPDRCCTWKPSRNRH